MDTGCSTPCRPDLLVAGRPFFFVSISLTSPSAATVFKID